MTSPVDLHFRTTDVGGGPSGATSAQTQGLPPLPSTSTSASPAANEVTHSLIAECAEAFRLLCDGRSGKALTAKDVFDLLTSNGLHPTEDDASELVRAIDQQGTGVISFSEFASLMLQGLEVDDVEYLRMAFAQLDPDATGYVSASQFMELLSTCGECSTPDEVHEMLVFADPDGTNRVNYERMLQTIAMRLR